MSQNLGDVVVLNDYYTQDGYVEANWEEIGGDAYNLLATISMTFTGQAIFDSTYQSILPSNCTFEAPNIYLNCILSIWNNGSNSATFNNSSNASCVLSSVTYCTISTLLNW